MLKRQRPIDVLQWRKDKAAERLLMRKEALERTWQDIHGVGDDTGKPIMSNRYDVNGYAAYGASIGQIGVIKRRRP